MNRYNRRRFLRLAAELGLALTTSQLLLSAPACKSPKVSGTTSSPGTAPAPRPTRVSAVLGHDLDAMVREALEPLGGMAAIVSEGDTVFIKPNFAAFSGWVPDNNTITNGQCTKPEIVLAVADECLKAGASKVIIGEAGQDLACRWEVGVTLDGRTDIVEGVSELNAKYGRKVSLEGLNNSTPRWVFVPSRTEFGQIAVSSLVIDADKVISVPVLKTHHGCAVTLSIKNFMGVTPIWLYGSPRMRLHECDMGVDQCFLDVVKGIQPDLAIIDASIGAEGNAPGVGPGEGRTVDVADRLGAWLILAGTDLLAVDSTATRIIGHDPQYVKHLREGFAQEMGEMREEYIELVGPSLADLRMDWEPSSKSGYPQLEATG